MCCAEDAESKQVHLNGVIIRDLSSVVSNYRSKLSLDEYLKKQNVRGIANVDTRAITRRLREAGNLNGVITSDTSKSDEELIAMAKGWNIVGQDLITDISIKEPYEWKNSTVEEWEFSAAVKGRNGTEPLHVSDSRCDTSGMRISCWKQSACPADMLLHDSQDSASA